MKSISESIIGRKGIVTSGIYILFPMREDYILAKKMFPEECKILTKCKDPRVENYVFCTDDTQLLKEYFKSGYPEYRGAEFPCPDSRLCVVNEFYFKNINQVKKWIQSEKSVDDIYQSNYVKVIDILKYIKTL